MAIDRLAELRAGSAVDDYGSDSLDVVDLENPKEAEDEGEKSLARYRKEMDAISEAIDSMNENVEVMDIKYQITVSSDVDPEDREYAVGEISRLLDHNERTSTAIRKRLKRIACENTEFARTQKEKTGELRVRVNTHQFMSRRFMESMQIFEESQDKHRRCAKKTLEKKLRRLNPDASDEDIEDAIRRGKIHTFVDDSETFDTMALEDQTRVRNEIEDLQCRNNDMKKLEAKIVELHQLFMDMQLLVETQGDLLNNIEYNIEDTKTKTGAGLQELVQARAHQKSAGKKKACIIALVVVILLIVTVSVLVKFVPIWFPKTKEVIDGLTSNTGANASTTPAKPLSSPAATTAQRSELSIPRLPVDVNEFTLKLLESIDVC